MVSDVLSKPSSIIIDTSLFSLGTHILNIIVTDRSGAKIDYTFNILIEEPETTSTTGGFSFDLMIALLAVVLAVGTIVSLTLILRRKK